MMTIPGERPLSRAEILQRIADHRAFVKTLSFGMAGGVIEMHPRRSREPPRAPVSLMPEENRTSFSYPNSPRLAETKPKPLPPVKPLLPAKPLPPKKPTPSLKAPAEHGFNYNSMEAK